MRFDMNRALSFGVLGRVQPAVRRPSHQFGSTRPLNRLAARSHLRHCGRARLSPEGVNVRGAGFGGREAGIRSGPRHQRRHLPNREKNMMRKMIAATTVAVGLVLAPSLDAVHAQDSTAAEDDDNGEIGLIGLAGLLGLGRPCRPEASRPERRRVVRHVAGSWGQSLNRDDPPMTDGGARFAGLFCVRAHAAGRVTNGLGGEGSVVLRTLPLTRPANPNAAQ